MPCILFCHTADVVLPEMKHLKLIQLNAYAIRLLTEGPLRQEWETVSHVTWHACYQAKMQPPWKPAVHSAHLKGSRYNSTHRPAPPSMSKSILARSRHTSRSNEPDRMTPQ